MIACKGCGQPSGISGDWKEQPDVLKELRARGYLVLHGGHRMEISGDPRCIVCGDCAAGPWRDGLGLKDMQKIHGSTAVQARRDA
jgi:hypothetical protein